MLERSSEGRKKRRRREEGEEEEGGGKRREKGEEKRLVHLESACGAIYIVESRLKALPLGSFHWSAYRLHKVIINSPELALTQLAPVHLHEVLKHQLSLASLLHEAGGTPVG